MEINNVYNCDCVELMQSMDNCYIDLTVTSPPYENMRNYNGYKFDFEKTAEELLRVTKSGGIVVWVVGDKIKCYNKSLTSFRQAIYFQEIGFNVFDDIIFKKRNTMFARTGGYTNCYEHMFVLSKGKPKTFNPLKEETVCSNKKTNTKYECRADGVRKYAIVEHRKEKTRNNIWEYTVGGGMATDKLAFKHPAIFPEELAKDHILSWSNKGDLIFDPFCGSGTTLKIAKMLNRNYIGCDISEEYCDIARGRVAII